MSHMPLSHEHKVTARTSREVAQGVRQFALREQSRGLKLGDRAIGIEGVIGAVLLEFLSRPPAEQDAIIDRRLPELAAQIGKGYTAAPAEPAAEPRRPRMGHPLDMEGMPTKKKGKAS